MFLILFLFISKNKLNKLVLKMGCFIKLLKSDGQFLEKQTWPQKIERKEKNEDLNLKFSRHHQISIFSMNKTGLKLISRQKKRIFTACCFNEIIFHVPIGSSKKNLFDLFSSQSPCNQIYPS